MWAYLDTPALIKLYIDEIGHAEVLLLCGNAQALFLTRITWVEAARKALIQKWPGYRIVELTVALRGAPQIT